MANTGMDDRTLHPHGFQVDALGSGAIRNSVNLFRGDINLPLPLISLPGPGGLDVSVNALYSSQVQQTVAGINAEQPTSVLGVGWSLPVEMIVRTTPAQSPFGSAFFLIDQGVANPLVFTGVEEIDGDPAWSFVPEQFEFWRIRYFPTFERWEITRESGLARIYGDNRLQNGALHALQTGLAHGTWVGPSAADGGSPYVTAWNLSEVANRFGDRIEFGYVDDLQPVAGGKYTRASYLSTITDVFERQVQFHYLPKTDDEFSAPHISKGGQHAFQDRYETKYLSSIDVAGADGAPLWSIAFGYRLDNLGVPQDGRFIKRYLTSVCQIAPDGNAKPATRFEYLRTSDPNIGALQTVTYPSGGTGTYAYARQPITAATGVVSGLVTVNNPNGGVPRVWFGDDYVVVTWYSASERKLAVAPYRWEGAWFTAAATMAIDATIVDETLNVVTAPDFFAVCFNQADAGGTTGTTNLNLFRKDPLTATEWSVQQSEPWPTTAAATQASLAAGRDFVVISPVGSSQIHRLTWSPSQSQWLDTQSAGDAFVALAATDGLFVVFMSDATGANNQVQLWFRAADSEWINLSGPSVSPSPFVFHGAPQFSWQIDDAFAVGTFITNIDDTNIDDTNIDYSLNVYQWDPLFRQLTVSQTESYVTSIASDLPAGQSLLTGDVVGSGPNLLRFDGNAWHSTQFTPTASGANNVAFDYGDDIAVMTQSNESVQALQFDPSTLSWGDAGLSSIPGSTAVQPFVNGDVLVIGSALYTRGADGAWSPAGAILPSDINAASVRNMAPSFLAYETSDEKSWIVPIVNGGFTTPVELLGGRIFVPDATGPGQVLAGPAMVVTYPANSTFDTAPALTLGRVISDPAANAANIGEQVDYPVVGITIDDGAQQTFTAYAYDSSSAIYDPSGSIAQYPVARVYQGVAQAPAPGDAGPYGFVEMTFFNGVSLADAGIFSLAEAEQSYAVFAGQIAARRVYDADRNVVEMAFSEFQIDPTVTAGAAKRAYARLVGTAVVSDVATAFTVDTDADPAIIPFLNDGQPGPVPASLVSAFTAAHFPPVDSFGIRIEQAGQAWLLDDSGNQTLYRATLDGATLTIEAGVCRRRQIAYDPNADNGLPSSRTSYKRDIDGTLQTIVDTTVYACTQYPPMKELHLLSDVATSSRSSNGVNAVQDVVTFQEWAPGAWDANATFRANTANATYDFSTGGLQTGWTPTGSITARTATGDVQENVTANGITLSKVFDTRGLPIARFVNASGLGGEASYYGAGIDETNPGWAIQPGNGDPTFVTSDSHTGERCLALETSPTNSLTLTIAQLAPTAGNTRYVFSFWCRTVAGFASESGSAQWQLSATAGSQTVTPPDVAIPDTNSAWVYVAGELDLGALAGSGAVAVTVTGQNTKTSTVLLDELRFSPVVGSYRAMSYDPGALLPEAAMGDNGATLRLVRDSLKSAVATTLPDGNVKSLSTRYCSRTGHGDQFSAADPNSRLKIVPAGDGKFQRFADGSDDWLADWTVTRGQAADWSVAGGALLHAAGTADTLTLNGSDAWTDFVAQFYLAPSAPLSSPVSIQLGSSLSAGWTPATTAGEAGAWMLTDVTTGQVLQSTQPQPRWQLPASDAVLLDAAQMEAIRRALAAQGCLISAAATSAVVTQGQAWRIDDTAQAFLITLSNETLLVTRATLAPGRWTCVILGGSLLLQFEGQTVLQHQTNAPIAGPLALEVSDAVAISDIVVGQRPRLSAKYTAGDGQLRQSHRLESVYGGATVNCVANAICRDDRGQAAVKTKPVRYAATGLGYQPGLVTSFDWTTGVMAGDVVAYYSAGGGGFSDDEGFPYLRTIYDASPRARVVARGNPGKDFAITGGTALAASHVSLYDQAACDGNGVFADLGLFAGEYSVSTVTDPNGTVTAVLRDKSRQALVRRTVEPAAQNGHVSIGYDYDAMGRAVAMRPGRFYDTGNPQWISKTTYDLLGRWIASTNPDQADGMEAVYNSNGWLRFSLPPAGQSATPPYFLYQKRDGIGRVVESGVVEGTWDRARLETLANDPAFPAGAFWTRRFTHDGASAADHQIGYVTARSVSDDGAAVAVSEQMAYDVRGRCISHQVAVEAFTTRSFFGTGYQYDNTDRLIRLDYPATAGAAPPLSVVYDFDSLGRVASVGDAGGPAYAAYTYNAAGLPESETWMPGSATSFKRAYAYISPGWLTGIADPLFSEQLTYVSGTGRSFFNGEAAEIEFGYSGPGAPSSYTSELDYDASGNLITASSTALRAASMDRATYDSNHNVLTVSIDGQNRTNAYPSDSNRITALDHDANGAVTSVPAGAGVTALSSVSYDRWSGVTRNLAWNSGASTGQMTVTYDGRNRRVLKTVAGADGGQTLSLSGGKPVSLGEIAGTGVSRFHIHGLGGILATVSGGRTLFVSRDHAGSTRVLVDMTGPSPAAAATYDYTPFGLPVRMTGTAGLISHLFQGMHRDEETGLYDTFRMYDPVLQRFLSTDPMRQFASPYVFVSNNPVQFVDPSGLFDFGGLFSDIASLIVSAAEIVAGVVVETMTFGGASLIGGALIGAGVDGVTYTAQNWSDFNWKSYGIQEGIGAAIGFASAGLGKVIGAVRAGAAAADAAAAAAAAADAAAAAGAGVAEGGADAAEELSADMASHAPSVVSDAGADPVAEVSSASSQSSFPSNAAGSDLELSGFDSDVGEVDDSANGDPNRVRRIFPRIRPKRPAAAMRPVSAGAVRVGGWMNG